MQDVLRPKELKPLGKYFTVVIFFSVLDYIPQCDKLLIKNIYWPYKTQQSDDNGNKIVETMCKIYSEAKSKKYLRLVCINSPKGDLSAEKANIILKYLKSSVEKSRKRSPVDVIFLPKFFVQTGKDAFDIMESLWYLREHAVLISSSSIHATLPSTETIAVKGAIGHYKSEASVLDFVVSYSGKDFKRKTSKQAAGKGGKHVEGEKGKQSTGEDKKGESGRNEPKEAVDNENVENNKTDTEERKVNAKEDTQKSEKEKEKSLDSPKLKSNKEKIIKIDTGIPGKFSAREEEYEWSEINRVQLIAPAAVSGMALTILDCLKRNGVSVTGNHVKPKF